MAAALVEVARVDDSQGRYADAEQGYKHALAIDEKVTPDNIKLALILNDLGNLYVSEGRFTDAEAQLKRSAAFWEKAGPGNPGAAITAHNLGSLYEGEERYAEAAAWFEQALAIFDRTNGSNAVNAVIELRAATTLTSLGGVYLRLGRLAEARPLIERSLAIQQKALGLDNPQLISSLSTLADLEIAETHYSEARPLLDHALEIAEKTYGKDSPTIVGSLTPLAGLYSILGRRAEAEDLYKRAVAIDENALGPGRPNDFALATALNNLGTLYWIEQRYDDARKVQERALAINEKVRGPDDIRVAENLNNLAVTDMRQGRKGEALAHSRRTVDILGKRLAANAGERGAEADADRTVDRLYLTQNVGLLYDAKAANYVDESFHTAQLIDASSAAAAIAGVAARFASGTDTLAAAIRERQDLALKWQRLNAAFVTTAGAEHDKPAEAQLQEQLAQAGKQLDARDARLAHDFPKYAELTNPRPLPVKSVQALLVYLAGYHLPGGGPNFGEKYSWLWAIRRDRAELYRLDIGAGELKEEVDALRRRLDPGLNPQFAPFDAKRSYALYQKIVAPAAPLLAGAKQVFVVPDGALYSLPMGVLVTKEPAANPTGFADNRQIAWLAHDYALMVLPSVGSLRALREYLAHAADAARPPFVGIGDPVLDGKPDSERGVSLASVFRGGSVDVKAVRDLPALPETAEELHAVAKDLGAGDQDLYLRERASEPVVREAGLGRYRIVEFATHGLVSGDFGLAEPALVLTPPPEPTPDNDGLLTVSKIATLKLDADWVVLSACNTAAPAGSGDASGLSGLAKAFFYSGARSVLVSNWPAVSEPTVKLIVDAFDEVKKDAKIGRAEALRRAEMAMLDPVNPAQYAHPMMWATFVLAGEGGAGR